MPSKGYLKVVKNYYLKKSLLKVSGDVNIEALQTPWQFGIEDLNLSGHNGKERPYESHRGRHFTDHAIGFLREATLPAELSAQLAAANAGQYKLYYEGNHSGMVNIAFPAVTSSKDKLAIITIMGNLMPDIAEGKMPDGSLVLSVGLAAFEAAMNTKLLAPHRPAESRPIDLPQFKNNKSRSRIMRNVEPETPVEIALYALGAEQNAQIDAQSKRILASAGYSAFDIYVNDRGAASIHLPELTDLHQHLAANKLFAEHFPDMIMRTLPDSSLVFSAPQAVFENRFGVILERPEKLAEPEVKTSTVPPEKRRFQTPSARPIRSVRIDKKESANSLGISFQNQSLEADIKAIIGVDNPVDYYVNRRHCVSLHLPALTNIEAQADLLTKLMDKLPEITSKTLDDGSLVIQMSQNTFMRQLGGQLPADLNNGHRL